MRSLLWANFRPLIRSPIRLLGSRTTRLLFAVYFGTYTTANILDTVAERLPESHGPIPASTVKLLGVSAISTGLTVYKDKCLTQMFGAVSRRTVPLASYALFTARDVLTIYGCLVLPPILAQRLDDIPISIKERFSLSSFEARTRAAQLLLPLMVQFFSTPVHLLALDLYNRQNWLSASARLARLKRDLPTAVPTRMLRILPAFGIGGLLNTEVRSAMQRALAAVDDDAQLIRS